MNLTEVLSGFREVEAERQRQLSYMNFRHPRFRSAYRAVLILTVFALTCSLYGWALDIWAQRRADRQEAAALALYRQQEAERAEQDARALAEAKKSREAILDRWSDAGARQLYGIRNFIDKYHYSESDLITYLRCPFNRYLYGSELTDLETIIFSPDQFLACHETSPVLKEYKALALKCFSAWLDESGLTVDPSYRFAELTPSGIYLVDEFNADGYVRRWHA